MHILPFVLTTPFVSQILFCQLAEKFVVCVVLDITRSIFLLNFNYDVTINQAFRFKKNIFPVLDSISVLFNSLTRTALVLFQLLGKVFQILGKVFQLLGKVFQLLGKVFQL